MSVKGKVFKYGNDVDTDVIIPARHLTSADPAHLASHCMEDIDNTFVSRVSAGDIMVAGSNFGLVIAESFARIFYRNAINVGLPIMECPEASAAINDGDEVEADFDTVVITDITTGQKFTAKPFPEFIKKIIAAGGLVQYTGSKTEA